MSSRENTLAKPVPPEFPSTQALMQLAKIIGHATATVKHPSLNGWRLLIVQMLDAKGKAEGDPLIAIDEMGSRRGDTVILTSDGKAVREAMKSDSSPVRWMVMGIED